MFKQLFSKSEADSALIERIKILEREKIDLVIKLDKKWFEVQELNNRNTYLISENAILKIQKEALRKHCIQSELNILGKQSSEASE